MTVSNHKLMREEKGKKERRKERTYIQNAVNYHLMYNRCLGNKSQ